MLRNRNIPAFRQRPVPWKDVAALIILVTLGYRVLHHLAFEAAKMSPDSNGYVNYDFSSLQSTLTNVRTIGYPLFLKLVSGVSPGLSLLSAVQAIICGLSVIVFWCGLRCYGLSSWAALAASVPLLFVEYFHDYIPYVHTESLGASLAIAAMGFLLIVLSKPKRILWWIMLSLAVLLAYQVRPAYLFLILLVPASGAALLLLRSEYRKRRAVLRQVGGLAVASLAPFILFCAFRWAVVGHFGLVSFGGTNAIGLSTEMNDEAAIQRLPPNIRPYALAVLHERYVWWRWKSDTLPPHQLLKLNFPTYNINVWRVAVPIARKLDGNDTVRINRRLTRTAKATFLANPRTYMQWILASALHAWTQVIIEVFMVPGLHNILFIPFLLFFVISRTLAVRLGNRDRNAVFLNRQTSEVAAVAVAGFGLFLSQMFLTVLVEPPLDRYTLAAAIFLPSILALATFEEARAIWCILRGSVGVEDTVSRNASSTLEQDPPESTPRDAGPRSPGRIRYAVGGVVLAVLCLVILWIYLPSLRPLAGLERAIEKGDLRSVKQILQRKPGLAREADGHGVTPLHLAAMQDETAAARILLSHGAQPNSPDEDGLTPLHWAAVAGHADLAALLLHSGAKVDHKTPTGVQPIHLAPNSETVAALLRAGANPNARDESGGTPLHWTTDAHAMHILLEAGADPDAREHRYTFGDRGWLSVTPLHLAVLRGNVAMVETLLSAGADANVKDAIGMTPLIWGLLSDPRTYALKRKMQYLIGLLLKYNANPNVRLVLGQGPYEKHCIGLPQNVIAGVRRFQAMPGGDITPLSLSAALGRPGYCDLLIRRGCSVNARSLHGMTPLHWAAFSGNLPTATLLISKGADPSARNSRGATPLDIAKALGHKPIIQALSH